MYIAEPGDILLYRKSPSIADRLVEFGERLEDGAQDREYYHVAIALNANDKIEAYGKSVAIHPIDYGNFDAFRPPIAPRRIGIGLGTIRQYVGQAYDWWLIIDDALRYISRGVFHLPVSFIRSTERRGKVCSSLVVSYFKAAYWGPNLTSNASPEDIWIAVKDYPVEG